MYSKRNQILLNSFLAVIALMCIIPFVLLIAASLTDETEIIKNGYSFFPQKMSLYAYEYLWGNVGNILHAYKITVIITVVGTGLSLLTMAMLAYPMSRPEYKLRNFLMMYVFIIMLINGGLVPTYILYVKYLKIKNTIWALIFPMIFLKGFYVIMIKTFFATIPNSIIESVKIDGGSEWLIFFRFVLPLSLPVLATVGLFQVIFYWNDWFNGIVFITEPRLYSIQNLLNRILLDIQFLSTDQMGGSYDNSSSIPRESVRMALAVIGLLPLFVSFPFFQRYFVKGITIGAIKE